MDTKIRNSATEAEGIFWFESAGTGKDKEIEQPLRLFTQQDHYTRSVIFEIKNDTLILDETDVDGPKRVFARVK